MVDFRVIQVGVKLCVFVYAIKNAINWAFPGYSLLHSGQLDVHDGCLLVYVVRHLERNGHDCGRGFPEGN